MSEKKDIFSWMLQGATFLGVAGGIWWLATTQEQNKSLQFSDQKIKVATETHTLKVDPVQLAEQRIRDSIAHEKELAQEKIFRRVQDSLDSVRDTLTKRNAVTVWQNRRNIDSVKLLLRQLDLKLSNQ